MSESQVYYIMYKCIQKQKQQQNLKQNSPNRDLKC